MTATIAPGSVVRMSGPGWLLANVATVTGRNLHRLLRVPTLIAFATVQPVLFVLLFTYAWGGAIHPPGVTRYIDYALPGIWVLAIAFGASQTGVALADDLATGMIDRFRALPMARSAVLAGRVAADAARNLFVLALMTGVGYATGSASTPGQPPRWPRSGSPWRSGWRSRGSSRCSGYSSATPSRPVSADFWRSSR
ncbi:ABC transporter permease [Micromonospora sp. U21]|uniref:ABC transporter permease n=1 Tax=Micromonospora sp. U21 TaxID=2824899 RepID=UPI001B372EA7|nr:ABC transporter permease [Micromonospora sp. U21]MBQ0906827.1 ABC transporter permease [Micromonospora sp. U21]